MIDNINKLAKNLDGNKQPTAASIVNLADDGRLTVLITAERGIVIPFRLADVVKIWDAVSTYIDSFMKQSKVTTTPLSISG